MIFEPVSKDMAELGPIHISTLTGSEAESYLILGAVAIHLSGTKYPILTTLKRIRSGQKQDRNL